MVLTHTRYVYSLWEVFLSLSPVAQVCLLLLREKLANFWEINPDDVIRVCVVSLLYEFI